jgi:hypothetical protein
MEENQAIRSHYDYLPYSFQCKLHGFGGYWNPVDLIIIVMTELFKACQTLNSKKICIPSFKVIVEFCEILSYGLTRYEEIYHELTWQLIIALTVVGFWCLVTMRSAILSKFEERGTERCTQVNVFQQSGREPTSLFREAYRSAAVADTVDNHYEK